MSELNRYPASVSVLSAVMILYICHPQGCVSAHPAKESVIYKQTLIMHIPCLPPPIPWKGQEKMVSHCGGRELEVFFLEGT